MNHAQHLLWSTYQIEVVKGYGIVYGLNFMVHLVLKVVDILCAGLDSHSRHHRLPLLPAAEPGLNFSSQFSLHPRFPADPSGPSEPHNWGQIPCSFIIPMTWYMDHMPFKGPKFIITESGALRSNLYMICKLYDTYMYIYIYIYKCPASRPILRAHRKTRRRVGPRYVALEVATVLHEPLFALKGPTRL